MQAHPLHLTQALVLAVSWDGASLGNSHNQCIVQAAAARQSASTAGMCQVAATPGVCWHNIPGCDVCLSDDNKQLPYS